MGDLERVGPELAGRILDLLNQARWSFAGGLQRYEVHKRFIPRMEKDIDDTIDLLILDGCVRFDGRFLRAAP